MGKILYFGTQFYYCDRYFRLQKKAQLSYYDRSISVKRVNFRVRGFYFVFLNFAKSAKHDSNAIWRYFYNEGLHFYKKYSYLKFGTNSWLHILQGSKH